MDHKNLSAKERLELLQVEAEKCDVNPSTPLNRYYMSGNQILRQADTYVREGDLETGYMLYLRYMSLFVEKVRNHPEFGSYDTKMKVKTKTILNEMFPKAEKLKEKLRKKFEIEYALQQDAEQRKQEAELQAKKISELERMARESKYREQLSLQKPIVAVPSLPSVKQIKYPDELEDEAILEQLANLPSIPDDFESTPTSVEPSELKPGFDVKPSAPSAPEISQTPTVPPSVKPNIPNHDPAPQKPTFDRALKPAALVNETKQVGDRQIVLPSKLPQQFLAYAQRNTSRNIETCGVLAGKLQRDRLIITHLIISKQKGSSDTCTTVNEEELFEYQDQHDLITLGWIHTHPSQTSFLSSIDLHTQFSYQIMMPEAIAIVCAPTYKAVGVYNLTKYGLNVIASCKLSGFHSHPGGGPIFEDARHVIRDSEAYIQVVDLRDK